MGLDSEDDEDIEEFDEDDDDDEDDEDEVGFSLMVLTFDLYHVISLFDLLHRVITSNS